jgi:hypothetical protein
MRLSAATVGQRFRIPDWHGGYAKCCGKAPATFEIVRIHAGIYGLGMKCVKCGDTVSNDSTFVQEIEVHESQEGRKA